GSVPHGTPEGIPEAVAVEATMGVLRSCAESKRVVFTSSIAATVPSRNNFRSDVDERTWTDVDALRHMVCGAAFNTLLVKTATEKAALEFSDRNGMDLVTLLPAVVGAFICLAIRHLSLKISRNGVVYRVSSKKLFEMGFEFKHGALGDMVDGAIQSCKHRGFIS
ncbi:Vestitone reductase, partial [Linum perenne]